MQKYFIGLIVLAVAVYDIYLVYTAGTTGTLSHMMIGWSYKYPAFPFLVGFLMGHLFWRMRDTSMTVKYSEDESDSGKS